MNGQHLELLRNSAIIDSFDLRPIISRRSISGTLIPGLDIPGFDVVSIAKGYGCPHCRFGARQSAAVALRCRGDLTLVPERLNNVEAIKKAAVEAWNKPKLTVLEIPISPQVPPLL